MPALVLAGPVAEGIDQPDKRHPYRDLVSSLVRADRAGALVRVLLTESTISLIMDVPVIRAKTPCENCYRPTAVAIAPSGGFVYLGCSTCGQIWSIRDRRREARTEEIRERKFEV